MTSAGRHGAPGVLAPSPVAEDSRGGRGGASNTDSVMDLVRCCRLVTSWLVLVSYHRRLFLLKYLSQDLK